MADFFNEIGHLFFLHKYHEKMYCNFVKFNSMLQF
jgi:hypothetical protein